MIMELEGQFLEIHNRIWEITKDLKDIREEFEYDPSLAPLADFDPLRTIRKYPDMSNSSSTTNSSMINSSDDNQTDLFAPELSELMGNPEMVEHLHAAFSEDLIGMMLVQYYQYSGSQNCPNVLLFGTDGLDAEW